MSTDSTHPSPLPALSRTRQARRALILQKSRGLFLRDGYNATTMERIAQEGGVSKATLYKYFADKDEVFFALVRERQLAPDERLIRDLHATIEQTLLQLQRHGTQEDLARALLRLLQTSVARRNDVFFRLLVEIAFARPGLLQQVRQEMLAGRLHDVLTLTVDAAAAMPPGVDGQALMHLVFIVIHGHMLIGDVALGEDRVDPERLAGVLAALIWSAIE